MMQYTVHWTYEVVPLPVLLEWEYEVFLTFHTKPVRGSHPLNLTVEEVRHWFFPEMFDYSEEYEIYDEGQKPCDLIKQVDAIGKIGEIICAMLNDGDSDYSEITVPLEDRAYKEWEEAHETNFAPGEW